MVFSISSISRRVIPVAAILVLSGCSDLDVYGLFDDEMAAPQASSASSVRARADADQARSEDSDTPSLTSVPSRPAIGSSPVRDRVIEGLIADRSNARYTDEAIRLQDSTSAAAAQQAASASTHAPDTTPAPGSNSTPAQIVVTPLPAQPAPAPAKINAAGQALVPAVSSPLPLSPLAAQIAKVPSPPSSTSPVPAPTFLSSTSASTLAASSSSSSSVVVDTTMIDGGSRNLPVSAQISAEAQVATIQFGHGSSNLGSRDRQVINAVAAAYRNGGRLLVVGHASGRTGQMPKDQHKLINFNVSFARANAVAQALIGAGVPPERVIVEAVSDDRPMYSEAMPTGEAGNRRAEIYVLQ